MAYFDDYLAVKPMVSFNGLYAKRMFANARQQENVERDISGHFRLIKKLLINNPEQNNLLPFLNTQQSHK